MLHRMPVQILYLGPMSQATAEGQADDIVRAETPADAIELDREILLESLHKAGKEIQDEDIKRYYYTLLEEYNLDEITSDPVTIENLVELMPDIVNINEKALSVPLREAGKNIRDPEIADFYYGLLERAGWDIE